MKKLVLAFFVLFAVLISICNTVSSQLNTSENIDREFNSSSNIPANKKTQEEFKLKF